MALYHTAQGSVNYTVVGSPTIVDGVVKYSNTSNYLKTITVPLSTASSFEINLSVKTDEEVEVFRGIFGNYSSIKIIKTGGAGNFSILAGGRTTTTLYVINTSYEINIKYNNGNYVISKNGTQINSYSGTAPTTDYPFAIGTTLVGSSSNTDGSANYNQIDLNSTYIKVNGQPWFGVCPVEVKKHQLMGPVGYTVTGSPTITDGVASNFSDSNYLSITSAFSPNTSDFEIGTEVETGSISSNQRIISDSNAASTSTRLIFSSTNKRFTFVVYDSTNEQQYEVASSVTVSANSNYAIKAYRQGTTLAISVSADGTNWTTDTIDLPATATFSNIALQLGHARGFIFSGSINLNKTYVKIKGKLWFFQPAPTKYIVKDNKLVFADSGLYLTGPNTYETLSDPTVMADGIYTNTGRNNPVQLSNSFDITSDDFSFRTVFSIANASEVRYLYCNPFGVRIDRYDVQMRLNRNGSNINTSMFTVQLNQWYILEIEKSGAVFTARYSADDGATYTSCLNLDTTGETLADISTVLPRFGKSTASNNFYGSIDFKRTYINVNGSLWFYGKNYATQNIAPVPAGYTFGTTTTPSIGYVDMRTQQFTAAPEGATIGRDE